MIHLEEVQKHSHNYRPELREKRVCLFCKRYFIFVAYASKKKAGGGKFCSPHCQTQYNFRYIINQEKRKKAARRALLGKNNHNWKGSDASYSAIHKWLYVNFRKSDACEICGTTEKKIEWSNRDHKYRRERKDWQSICRKCHRKYDKDHSFSAGTNQ